MPRDTVVTIDGPVGVGKSSVAREVATALGYRHLDTGAMYRAVTLAALEQDVDLNDQETLSRLARTVRIELVYEDDSLRVILDGKDVSDAIRENRVSATTSPVADCRGVRKEMAAQQRILGDKGTTVVEGRDMGTVVFPEATHKFYLDAAPAERAERRLLQLKNNGKDAGFEEVFTATVERDRRDRIRSYGALKIAPKAVVVDTTGIEKNEVVNLIHALVQK